MPRNQVGQTSTVELIAQALGNSTSGTTPISIVNPGGSNTALVICISTQDSNDANLPVSSVTVGGSGTGVVKALHSRDSSNDTNCEIYYKLNPDVGTQEIVVTPAGGVFQGVVAGIFSGVSQEAPEVTASSQGSASSISSAVTTLTNFSLIVQAVSHKPAFSSTTAPAITLGSTAGQSFEHCTGTYKIQGTAGATTMGQAWGSSSSYAQAIAVFKPVSNIVARTAAATRTVIPSVRTTASI